MPRVVTPREANREPFFASDGILSLFASDRIVLTISLPATPIYAEAKFTYDLSPIAVSYENKYRAWYDYLTSLMAIIGGIFTVVGMLESGIHSISSKKNR